MVRGDTNHGGECIWIVVTRNMVGEYIWFVRTRTIYKYEQWGAENEQVP